MIDHGNVIAEGTSDELKDRVGVHRHPWRRAAGLRQLSLRGCLFLGGLAGAAGFDLTLATNAATPGPVVLTVGGNNADTVLAGALSGSGRLIKDGGGGLTLSGFNAHSGGTT